MAQALPDEYVSMIDEALASPMTPEAAEPLSPPVLDIGMDEAALVQLCRQFKEEARSAREGGSEPRDKTWSDNLDLYMGRMDFSGKADWQHKEVMRDATKLVDRFAAAIKRALLQPGKFYKTKDLTPGLEVIYSSIERLLDAQLEKCSTTISGAETRFAHGLSKVLKTGAVMTMAASVSYDADGNRVRMDPIDPRELYYDPTGRGMYRIRTRELDKHVVDAWGNEMDANGVPLYFADRIAQLEDMTRDVEQLEKEQATGHSAGTRPTARKTRVIDEFLFNVLVNMDGVAVAKNVVVVMANEQRIIRGPETNPHWHGKDWIVCQPILEGAGPGSVYGRTYMEDFAPLARTLSEMTNLIVDGTMVGLLPNYVIRPDLLDDPRQIADGLRPFKLWLANEDAMNTEDVMARMELGSLKRESIEVWSGIESKLREIAMQNQIDLGQFAGKSGTTATEVSTVRESGSEIVMDIAENIDDGFIGPVLERMFYCALQHCDLADPALVARIGEPVAAMLREQREDFRTRRFGFKVSGITALADRAVRIRTRLQLLQILGQNETLVQLFAQSRDVPKVLDDLWTDLGIDAVEYMPTSKPEVPVPPDTQARVAAEQAAAERARQGTQSDAIRAQAAQRSAAAAEEQAAMQAELAARQQQQGGGE